MKSDPTPKDNIRISSIQTAQRVLMGENWIEQPLPSQITQRVGPFLLIHHWQDYFPGGQEPLEVGVGPHPHRGFSPVTCIYSGALAPPRFVGQRSCRYFRWHPVDGQWLWHRAQRATS
jgi:hypothetical protein